MRGLLGRWTPIESRAALPARSGVKSFRILPGASYTVSTLEVANKVYVIVKSSSPLVTGSATNTTTDPTYANSPREMPVLINSGDAAFCNTVAAAQLALRKEARYKIAGIPLRLRDGLAIQRGTKVSLIIPRAGIYGNFAVRRLQHDFASNMSTIDVAEYAAVGDDIGAQVDIAQALAQLEKETAI